MLLRGSQSTKRRIVVGLSIKSLSSFVLLVYAGRNVKAFIVPINDYKKENKDERKIDKKYVADEIS